MRTSPAIVLSLLMSAVAVTACQAGATPETTELNSTLYRYAGSRQCEAGGVTPQEVRDELVAGGINVIGAGCGTDGRIRTAMCGASDGRIVVIQVGHGHAKAAEARGFRPLAELPGAARTECR